MGLISEFRARARHVIGPALAVCVSGYFGYHVFHGERGMTAWVTLQSQVDEARAVLDGVRAERRSLERRVALLKADSLDPDMLDERARRMLDYGKPGEIVILLDAKGQPR